jgi:Asp-tRNA(Asn)/Glu-tRNA(Gln) amidotransferase C subunit
MKKFDVAEYVDRTAAILDLDINPEYRENVIANFEKIHAIAQLVNEFPIPDVEALPTFEP